MLFRTRYEIYHKYRFVLLKHLIIFKTLSCTSSYWGLTTPSKIDSDIFICILARGESWNSLVWGHMIRKYQKCQEKPLFPVPAYCSWVAPGCGNIVDEIIMISKPQKQLYISLVNIFYKPSIHHIWRISLWHILHGPYTIYVMVRRSRRTLEVWTAHLCKNRFVHCAGMRNLSFVMLSRAAQEALSPKA